MPFAYNASKNGKHANAALYKHEETNSKQIWDELVIQENDGFYYLFGHCSRFTDIQNFDDKKWEFTAQKISFKIAKKDYKTNYKGVEKEHTQSIIEKFACIYLEKIDKSLIYTGSTHLQHIPMTEMVVSGELNSKPELIEANFQSYFQLTAIAGEPKLIKNDEFIMPDGQQKQYSGGATGQTELQKLNDRMTFYLQQMKVCFPQAELNNVSDLIKLLSEDGEQPGYVTYCGKLISNIATLDFNKVPF